MRQIEQYKKMAAENDRLAQAVNDEAFQTMYSKFARQWREAAKKAEIANPVSDHLRIDTIARGTISPSLFQRLRMVLGLGEGRGLT
jgi:hypothetical protein